MWIRRRQAELAAAEGALVQVAAADPSLDEVAAAGEVVGARLTDRGTVVAYDAADAALGDAVRVTVLAVDSPDDGTGAARSAVWPMA